MQKILSNLEVNGKTLEWRRLPEIFPNKELAMWLTKPSQKGIINKGIINSVKIDSEYMPTVFNSIKDKNFML